MRNTQEGGMVLIISLVVLLILTILGTAAMKTTVVEERLTGFTRSKQISFDSSEAAPSEQVSQLQTIFRSDQLSGYLDFSPLTRLHLFGLILAF